MSVIREDQLDNAKKFMSVFWQKIVKPYYNTEETDEYWKALFTDMSKVGEAFCRNDTRLKHMMYGFEKGLEETRDAVHRRDH